MILYRPVGLQELVLIYDSGMQAFPPTRCAHLDLLSKSCDEHEVPVQVSGTIVTLPASPTNLLPGPSGGWFRMLLRQEGFYRYEKIFSNVNSSLCIPLSNMQGHSIITHTSKLKEPI